jgi:hypothetical protein
MAEKQRKPLNKQPSLRQQNVLKIMVENPKTSASKAMIAAGYSPQSAKNPQRITHTESFRLLMEKAGIDDVKVLQTLNDGLAAQNFIKTERVEGIGKTRLKTEEVVAVPDLTTRHKYLETTLRLKGLAAKDNATTIQFNNFAQEQRATYDIS